MKRSVQVGIVVILLAGLLISFYSARTTSGSLVVGFSEVGGINPRRTIFFEQAETNLASFLKSNGFALSESPVQGEVWAGGHSPVEKEYWYKGTYRGSREFYVLVRKPLGKSQGLQAYVWWNLHAFRWQLDEEVRKFNGFQELLAKWWKDQKTNDPAAQP